MTMLKDILGIAAQRAAAKGLPYQGELTPQEAFDLLQQGTVVLVDVRSRAELELVGRVPDANHVEWAFYPGMVANADFASQLQAQVDKGQAIVFMCRTGGRSHNVPWWLRSWATPLITCLKGLKAKPMRKSNAP